MDSILHFFKTLLHVDKELLRLIGEYGSWVYGILFSVIFLETGLVVTPFLPGDSLLFAAGALAGQGALRVELVFFLLFAAAVIGDNVNYWVGRLIGEKISFREDARILKKKYLDQAHGFYEKYGTRAIIIGRFIPIVRTVMPFAAGLGRMTYKKYLPFDVLGGAIWVGLFVFGGYAFGNLEIVQERFSLVVIVIIVLSLLPAGIEIIRNRKKKPPMVDTTTLTGRE